MADVRRWMSCCGRHVVRLLMRPGCHIVTAKLHPARAYYYRKNVDMDKVIEQCTRKVCKHVALCVALLSAFLCLSLYRRSPRVSFSAAGGQPTEPEGPSATSVDIPEEEGFCQEH